jgi:hypothetical protein
VCDNNSSSDSESSKDFSLPFLLGPAIIERAIEMPGRAASFLWATCESIQHCCRAPSLSFKSPTIFYFANSKKNTNVIIHTTHKAHPTKVQLKRQSFCAPQSLIQKKQQQQQLPQLYIKTT